ncbi:MAG TPA: lipase maturation factor family protein [Verrucomicrobiae bacterium]|nr:lipase maturation factor family protein [Verrucomicrobiae bacterium]
MKSEIRLARLPERPLLIFDGDCHFCRFWVRRWKDTTAGRVDFLPSQDPQIGRQFPEIPAKAFEKSIYFLQPEGSVYFGAEAAFRALATNPERRRLLRVYEKIPPFAKAAETAYAFIASHRMFFSWVTRLGWGSFSDPPSYFWTRTIFTRGLALIYLLAFLSLWVQVDGLFGSHGIVPVSSTISAARQQLGTAGSGLERFRLLPTFCWWNTTDRFLDGQCAAGVVFASLALVGVSPPFCFLLLWLLYLSLCSIGGVFFGYQWDVLLLETGFLAIFFAPTRWLSLRAREEAPPLILLWLLRLLLFRLMLESGCVKIFSGDPTWRNFTALVYHYETQPLPAWTGWYAAHLPLFFQKCSTFVVLLIELVCPFLIFGPRRARVLACGSFIFLQGLILATGNYCFFNLLTILLDLLLLDDSAFGRMSCWRIRSRRTIAEVPQAPGRCRWPRGVQIAIAVLSIGLTLIPFTYAVRIPVAWPRPLLAVCAWFAPCRSFNSYGLFAVMTTNRAEIIIEGSNDGTRWQPYEFPYKPGKLDRRPAFVAPHQPRLDWQMWFAALGSYRENPWLLQLCARLLEGRPEVLSLLASNPFPDRPPRYIRAQLYMYHFTDHAMRRRTGQWWRREPIGEYIPPISLRNDSADSAP